METSRFSKLQPWRERESALPVSVWEWIDSLPESVSESQMADAAELLPLLDRLEPDAATRAAALIHPLLQAHPALKPPQGVPKGLLDGQNQAEKVWSIHAEQDSQRGAEGLRRLLLSIVHDLRVVPILLARQLLRMRQASRAPDDERRRLARLTADIHAPLANRLGIWQLKWELEDLAFRYLQPETFQRIAKLLDGKRRDREQFIETCIGELQKLLGEAGITADIAGRPKHIFSIWKKMQRKDVPFGELYDIRAIRVLVDDVATCYSVLGLVHGRWTPIPAEFDDYIANPKGNNYRSLHTAVVGPEGKTLEVQIRTREMHAHAELGVAAHWRYKEGGSGDAGFERKIAWMRQLLEGRDGEDDGALLAGLNSELAEDRIYVLTPRGEVIDLPRGGTPLDFAYHVHTEVGHRCRGAKVNGRIVTLQHALQSGDRVEILTGKESQPRRDWLQRGAGYLASARARDKVRAWFHRLDHAANLREGRELLEREMKRVALSTADVESVLPRLRLATLDDLHVAIALGDVSPSQVARAVHEKQAAAKEPEASPPAVGAASTSHGPGGDDFVIEGVGNLLTQLARCCQPVAGDAISGYLTRGRGITIHREGCATMERLAARHPERVMQVEWRPRGRRSYSVDVQIRAVDRKGLLKDLTHVIATANAHVLGLNTQLDDRNASALLSFRLKVNDFEQLAQLLGRLSAVPGVNDARRLQ